MKKSKLSTGLFENKNINMKKVFAGDFSNSGGTQSENTGDGCDCQTWTYNDYCQTSCITVEYY